jgi:hypothetical protein
MTKTQAEASAILVVFLNDPPSGARSPDGCGGSSARRRAGLRRQTPDSDDVRCAGWRLLNRTRPDDVIVAFGMNWNPEVPYYARRRALMWPGWADLSPEGKDIANAVAKLAGYRIGAVVSCSRSLPDAVLERFRALGGISAADPWTMSARTTDDGNYGQCTVYFR